MLSVQELADRLLPAFDTPSGIPLSWINLAKVRTSQAAPCTCQHLPQDGLHPVQAPELHMIIVSVPMRRGPSEARQARGGAT